MSILRKPLITLMVAASVLSGCITFYLNNIEQFVQGVEDWLDIHQKESRKAVNARVRNDEAAYDDAIRKMQFACKQISDLKLIGREVLVAYFSQLASRAAISRQQLNDWNATCSDGILSLNGQREGSRFLQEKRLLSGYAGILQRKCGCPYKRDTEFEDLSDCDPKNAIGFSGAPGPNDDGVEYGSAQDVADMSATGVLAAATLGSFFIFQGKLNEAELRRKCEAWHQANYLPQRQRVLELTEYCSPANKPQLVSGPASAQELQSLINEQISVVENFGTPPSLITGPTGLYGMAFYAERQCRASQPIDVGGIARNPNNPNDGYFDQEPQQSPSRTPGGYVPPPVGPMPGDPITDPPVILDPPLIPAGEIPPT